MGAPPLLPLSVVVELSSNQLLDMTTGNRGSDSVVIMFRLCV